MSRILLAAVVVLCSSLLFAQSSAGTAQDTTQEQVTPMANTPVYRVSVVARTVDAVNYQHRSGSTKIDFRGTTLMPDGTGQAKVESRSGRLDISVELKRLRNANYFGPEYLTYVLWAITPEGRPVNLGEVTPNDRNEAKISVTTSLQAFGMIVTAEPYFAVTRPSNVTVLENEVRRDTKGAQMPITAKYEATEKGEYTVDLAGNQLPSTQLSREEAKKVPLTLQQARNAVAIARATGAEHYAPQSFTRAEESLNRAEDYLRRKQSSSAIGTAARGAAQSAEDARVLTIRRKADERVAQERQQQEQRATLAQQQAELAQNSAVEARVQQQQAEQAAAQAQRDRAAAEQAKAEALQAKQEAEVARQQALAQQQQLAAQTQAAQAQAQTAEQRAQAAEQEKEQMRQRLLTQLNQVLQTRDTARGLIVNMSDVLFDLNQATLKPDAKIRLAKVAGIIEAYPDLRLQIEGYTDSTGTVQYNQELSERRAAAVRDFLVSQGVNLNSVTAQGFGPSNPVASNSTASGRQANRRVDLVVNGASIAAQHPENQGGSVPGAVASPSGTAPNPAPADQGPR